MFYIWLGIVIILGFIEVITINLVTIWFVISGLIALACSFIIDSFIIQFSIFVILGLILMLATRKSLKKVLIPNEKTNLDRIIGTKGHVTDTIEKDGVGEVKVDGKKWSAIADETIEAGSIVKILAINGVKLKVEKWEEK